ncbi:MAG: ADP-ribosylglycohydrolase family protein [Myxococcales bacterium]|nr:ADP-ribosylglycohydrolase family protein [Myxococcales bacterium]
MRRGRRRAHIRRYPNDPIHRGRDDSAWVRGFTRGICALEALIAKAYLRWNATQSGEQLPERDASGLYADSRLHHRRAPGNTCLGALAKISETTIIPSVDSPPNDSKGCGAVMRVAPIGLCYRDRRAAFEMARDCAVITHGHPSGYWSAAYLAALVHDLARGIPIASAVDNADALLADRKGNEEMVAILGRVRKLSTKGTPDMKTIESLGAGWVGEEALAIALLCAWTCDLSQPRALEEALWRSAAHSGDSDSTAAITGNLLGAMQGASALPTRWLEKLELRDVVERIARHLHQTWIMGREPDSHGYPAA